MAPRNIVLLTIILLGCVSCKRGITVDPAKGRDVYVAGFTRSASNTVASYWKNGTLVTLTNPAVASNATSIVIVGNDVYVAGNMLSANGHFVAVYWKNGVVTRLADSAFDTGANAIAVSGNNVYVAGGGPNGPVSWKNGTMVSLPSSGTAETTGIAVNGNDVYVSGFSSEASGPVATFWKNGNATALTSGNVNSTASGITVQGNDVYVSGTVIGFLLNTAVYWKNGAQVNLTTSAVTGNTGGITVSDDNVYVAGEIEPASNVGIEPGLTAMIYWKNSTLANPQSTAMASSNMNIGGIAVAGVDVYVAGNFGNYPAYWKNGVLVQFTGNQGMAQGIAVAQH
jgi:hypothetical protein